MYKLSQYEKCWTWLVYIHIQYCAVQYIVYSSTIFAFKGEERPAKIICMLGNSCTLCESNYEFSELMTATPRIVSKRGKLFGEYLCENTTICWTFFARGSWLKSRSRSKKDRLRNTAFHYEPKSLNFGIYLKYYFLFAHWGLYKL